MNNIKVINQIQMNVAIGPKGIIIKKTSIWFLEIHFHGMHTRKNQVTFIFKGRRWE